MNGLPRTWTSPTITPARYELLELRLPDNSIKQGVWTGVQWWCDGHAVRPQAWRGARTTFRIPTGLRWA